MAPESERCSGFWGPVWEPVIVLGWVRTALASWVTCYLHARFGFLETSIWGSFLWKIHLKTFFCVAQHEKGSVGLGPSLWCKGNSIVGSTGSPEMYFACSLDSQTNLLLLFRWGRWGWERPRHLQQVSSGGPGFISCRLEYPGASQALLWCDSQLFKFIMSKSELLLSLPPFISSFQTIFHLGSPFLVMFHPLPHYSNRNQGCP